MSTRDVMMIEETSLPAGFGNFDRTIFEYSPEIVCTTTGTTLEEFILAKFVAPETGTYKYTFDSANLGSPKQNRFSLHSASYLGVKSKLASTTGYVPEMKFEDYLESSIGALSNAFAKLTGGTWIYEFMINNLSTYGNSTTYFPANKGQAMILVSGAVLNFPFKIKNQKITY